MKMSARAVCGTESGYRRHLADRSRPCVRCCDAHALQTALHRARVSAGRTLPDEPLRYRAVLDGTEPAEALTTADRHRLVTALHAASWTDLDIASHTRMTLYTAARIRGDLLHLPVNRPRPVGEGVA